MTQEQKDLLLKDLCARLPYGVWIERKLKSCKFGAKCMLNAHDISAIEREQYEFCKPYLFPLSSMTDEQKNSFPFSYSFLEALIDDGVYFGEDECITLNDMIDVIQWCYKNHFDIHGLIPMGLANDTTGLNIY